MSYFRAGEEALQQQQDDHERNWQAPESMAKPPSPALGWSPAMFHRVGMLGDPHLVPPDGLSFPARSLRMAVDYENGVVGAGRQAVEMAEDDAADGRHPRIFDAEIG